MTTEFATFPPGDRIGILDLNLQNRSQRALVLRSVRIAGPGVGGVVRVVTIEAAPLSASVHAVPETAYMEQPPVNYMPAYGGCHVQALEPLAGYRLSPGSQARVWLVLQAVSQGVWKIQNFTVWYTQGGVTYHQMLDESYTGKVAQGAPSLHPLGFERPCLKFATPLEKLP